MGNATVFVFSGEGGRFPSGVFSTRESAESWIAQWSLTGLLTEYVLDTPAYELSIARGSCEPSKPHHRSSDFIGKFAGGEVHWHYEQGRLAAE